MENEITKCEEITETAKAIGMSNGFKCVVGLGLTAAAGYAVYRFIIKPSVEKRKARKIMSECVDRNSETSDDGNESESA